MPLIARQWRGMGSMVAYYSFLREALRIEIGHNALAALTYIGVFSSC